MFNPYPLLSHIANKGCSKANIVNAPLNCHTCKSLLGDLHCDIPQPNHSPLYKDAISKAQAKRELKRRQIEFIDSLL